MYLEFLYSRTNFSYYSRELTNNAFLKLKFGWQIVYAYAVVFNGLAKTWLKFYNHGEHYAMFKMMST